MSKKVLITGATGNIGSQLVPILAANQNLNVVAFIRDPEKAAPLEAAGAEVTFGTFEDEGSVQKAVEGVDT
ncbi:MAG: NAD(P)H-binding protein, partial [Anaerolineales bacterium]|nr:NAD(P)H-binding protein [Anaerolineales bacterium]